MPAAIEHQILLDHGLRATRARLQILEVLRRTPAGDAHVSVEDIYRRLMYAKSNPTMATIYRVLGEFERRGLVARHYWRPGQGAALFELMRRQRHDHLVCVESGKVTEFSNGAVADCLLQLSREHGVELVNYNLVVYTRPQRAKTAGDD